MKAYLKTVEIHEGCFSGEKGVVIEDHEGEEFSGFFENEHIRNNRLEVIVVSEKDGAVLIKLPGRTLEGSGSHGYLSVKKQNLKYIA